MKKLFLSLMLGLVSYLVQAQVINVSTGIDNAGNSLTPPNNYTMGGADPNWKMINISNPTTYACYYYGGYWQSTPVSGTNAGWINNTGLPLDPNMAIGNDTLERDFSIASGITNFSLNFAIAYDDNFISLEIVRPNGTTIPITVTPTTPYQLSLPITNTIATGGMAGTWKIRAVITFSDIVAGFLLSGRIQIPTATSCNVLFDGFDNPSAWTHPLTAQTCPADYNQIGIAGSTFNFINAKDNHFNYMYQSGLSISNSNWKADIDFTPTAFGTFYGVGHHLMSITNGTKAFSHDDASGTCSNTPICFYPGMTCGFSLQQGISLYYGSDFPINPTIYGFEVRLNDGSGSAPVTIASVPTNYIIGSGTYYPRIERTGATTGVLSVFSDAARTIHITGSPVNFTLPASIGSFNTVSIGVEEGGYYPRELSATLDNLCISNTAPPPTQCNVVYDGFDSPNLWVHPLTSQTCPSDYAQINIAGSNFNFNQAKDNHFNYMYRSGLSISPAYWKTDIDFTPIAFGPSNGVGHNLVGLTNGTKAFTHDDASGTCSSSPICSYPGMTCGYSLQQGVSIYYGSDFPGFPSQWGFYIRINDGTGAAPTVAAFINSGNIAGAGTFYPRMERTGPTTGVLSVFTNAARTIHMAGSPVSFTLPASIGAFNTVTIGVEEGGYFPRELTAFMDNLCISNTTPPCTTQVSALNVTTCAPTCAVTLLGSPAGGTYTAGAGSISGNIYTGPSTTYTYTLPATATCPSMSATATVTITPPPTITGLVATSITSACVTLNWMPPSNSCVWYEQQWRNVTAAASFACTPPNSLQGCSSGGPVKNLSGLTPGNTYEVRVRSKCGNASGPWAYVTFTMLTGCTPQALKSTVVCGPKVTLTWSGCPGIPPCWYDIQYSTSITGPWTTVTSTTPIKTLTGLAMSTTYYWRVRTACSACNIGAWSAIASFTTLACKPSDDGMMIESTTHSVYVYPNPASDNVTIELDANLPNTLTICVMDMSGRILQRMQKNVIEGRNYINVITDQLANGVYMLNITEEGLLLHQEKINILR